MKQVLRERRKGFPSKNAKEKKEMRKMKKVIKMMRKILCVLTITMLLGEAFGFTSMAASTEDLSKSVDGGIEVEVLEAVIMDDIDMSSGINPYTMLASCIIGVRGASDGMHIDISTGVVGTASVLGVKDVKIYKKTWYGGWDLVAVSSGGEAYDRTNMGITILYENAVKDAKYKITCIHYGDVNGYIEGENDSGEFTFTY